MLSTPALIPSRDTTTALVSRMGPKCSCIHQSLAEYNPPNRQSTADLYCCCSEGEGDSPLSRALRIPLTLSRLKSPPWAWESPWSDSLHPASWKWSTLWAITAERESKSTMGIPVHPESLDRYCTNPGFSIWIIPSGLKLGNTCTGHGEADSSLCPDRSSRGSSVVQRTSTFIPSISPRAEWEGEESISLHWA